MKRVRLRDVVDKGSSTLLQRDAECKTGKYPVFAASGIIGYIDSYQQEKECIALVKDGSIGKVYLLPPKSSAIATIQYLIPKKGFSAAYLSYCIQSIDFSKYKQGAAIPHIYFRDYGDHVVSVEESPEKQLEIVAQLKSLEKALAQTKSNTLRERAQAVAFFQSILNDLMCPKAGWRECLISDIIDSDSKVTYGIVQPGDNVDGGIPIVRPVDLGDKEIYNNDSLKQTLPDISYKYKRTILNGKEILLCVRGTTGVLSLSTESLIGCNVTRGIVPFKIGDDTLRKYVYYWLQAPIASSFIRKFTQGAALKQINIADVKRIPVFVPSQKEQERIVPLLEEAQSIVTRLDKNCSQIEAQCALLYKAVLEEIFT